MRQSFLCMVILVIMCLAYSAAADTIDPKQSCGTLARVIGEGDADKVAGTISSHSRGGMSQGAESGAQQMIAFVKQQGRFILAEFMAEREYGERYKLDWYLLLFEGNQLVFLLCEYLRPDNAWQLVNINFNSDFAQLPTP